MAAESPRDGYISTPETSIVPALKEALFDQQQLLQKLYGELDAEREATASAANETMSMILRLQEEKAAVMMEAKQYKRLAEEKMGHAEQTLEVLEELIYHKEMEVASLEFQVQAYRYKLMSLGWNTDDFSVAEGRFPRCDREMLSASNIARAISLPTMKGLMEKLPSFKVEEYYDPDDVTEDEPGNSGNVDSYWEQIQRLDERVKEISRENLIVSFPPSPSSARERNNVHFGEFKRDKDESVATSSSFRDVSVVPQSEETNGNHHKVKGRGKFVSFGENVVFGENPELKHYRERATRFQDHETVSPRQKSENDNVPFGENVVFGEKPDSKYHRERTTCFQDYGTVSPRQKDENDNLAFGEKPELKQHWERAACFQDHETVSPRQKGENDNVAFGFQQICTRIDKLERNVMGREFAHEGGEEIVLLKEIKDQLNYMQKDMTLRKNRKKRHEDDVIITLMEAMLHFW